MDRLKNVWGWLTEPSSSVQRPDRRRQAQLLASTLVCLIVLSVLAEGAMSLWHSDGAYAGFGWMAVSIAILVVAYGLSRTRYYQIAAILVIAVASAATFMVSVYGNDPPDLNFLAYLIVPILVSIMFVSLQTTAIFALVNVLGLLILPALDARILLLEVAAGPLSYFVILVTLILLVDYQQKKLEWDRQAELAENNARLRMEMAEREKAERALRQSEKKYRLLVENIDDLICEVDAAGRMLFANSQYRKALGYSPPELLGSLSVEFLHPDERERSVVTFDRLLDSMEPSRDEWRFRHKSGEWRWFECVATPYVKPPGDVRVVVIGRDITQRKNMGQRLRQQERLAAVGQLSAGIAHDFRNLLTTIILYANLALRQPDLPSKLVRNLETIIGESQKAADLVQQILDFSSRSMIQVQNVDLQSLTRDVIKVLQHTVPENIRLTLAAETKACVVVADPGRIEQVLMNLALNSRDAMPEGGKLHFELSRIRLGAEDTPPTEEMSPGEWICLTVSDTGTGMTQEVRDHLFEPFFTTKEVGKGTGLGLAQVYGIIRQHGGYIDVETEVGEGTTFYIYLPIREGQQEIEKELGSAMPQGRGETILLVEDDAPLREAAQSILESLGYRMLVAANGQEALAIYGAENRIDLVITDMVMPEMGGKALIQEMKRTAPHLKALGLTGYVVEKVSEDLRAEGFLDVIYKPFEIETLAQAVRDALERDTH